MMDDNRTDIEREGADIIERYGKLINKVCYFYAQSPEEFDDLRQEALLNIWRSRDSFRGDAKVSTWLYRIVLNSCISYVRQNAKHNVEAAPADQCITIVADSGDKAAMIDEMYCLIDRLDPVDKTIVMMWIDGNSYDDIAAAVGLKAATIGSRLFRIKEKLVNFK